jgi:hypothetical protein
MLWLGAISPGIAARFIRDLVVPPCIARSLRPRSLFWVLRSFG